METIIDYLRRKLKEAGARRWAAIAAAVSVNLPEEDKIGEALLRKIAYGDRDNPGVATIQPLLDLFGAIDRGEATLPEPAPAPTPAEQGAA